MMNTLKMKMARKTMMLSMKSKTRDIKTRFNRKKDYGLYYSITDIFQNVFLFLLYMY